MNKRAALPSTPTPGSDTVYLTVVDRDRMAVSFINSLYSNFGIGICTEKTGILLTNRGACFTLEPDHPNTFGPDKRPMHTIIPALAMRDGRCDMSFGVMGAHYQPMGHVQIVLNMLDYGMDVQQAIDAPRFFFEGEQTVVEHGTPTATIDGLKARGHNVAMAPIALGRRADHQDRLGSRRADRRLRAAQGRLRAGVLKTILLLSFRTRAKARDPKSRCKLRDCSWIPGSRAALAPRNDHFYRRIIPATAR